MNDFTSAEVIVSKGDEQLLTWTVEKPTEEEKKDYYISSIPIKEGD